MKKRFICISIVLSIAIIGLAIFFVMNSLRKNSNSDMKAELGRWIKNENQTITLDDYKITLMNSVFAEKTGDVYFEVSIESENHDMRNEYSLQLEHLVFFTFGVDDRYYFYTGTDETSKVEAYESENKLIAKVMFSADYNNLEKLYIYDKTTGKPEGDPESAVGEFSFTKADCCKVFSNGIRTICLSPFSMLIERTSAMKSLTINMKNGQNIKIISEGNVNYDKVYTYGKTDAGDIKYIKIVLNNILDTDNVAGIEINGEQTEELTK